MTAAAARGVEANLLGLFQTLGIERAHIAAGGPPVLTDWHGLVIHHADRVASLILPSPPVLDTADFVVLLLACLYWLAIRVRLHKVRRNCSRISRMQNLTSCVATIGNPGRM